MTTVRKITPVSYKPNGKRMLCRLVGELKVSTIIHTPDSAKKKSLLFEVLAKGRDCVDDEIEVGTYFYTGQFAAMWLEFPDHDDWYTINEIDVVGTVSVRVDEAEIRGAA